MSTACASTGASISSIIPVILDIFAPVLLSQF
jgi:hypothetical protein